VSAGQAVPAAKGPRGRSVPRDPVRALQHALYRAAKADPGRKFHALTDKVYRRDVLQRGWAAVRANNGAPGIDKTTLAEVEEYGVGRLLDELVAELREGRSVVAFQSPNQLGLITLSGIVVAPRPFRDWRAKPNAGGERRR
jgi:RNA-directed DNA polymerase